jgi:diamine N-acetyltransferase
VAGRLVGIIGCENLDRASGKTEMRKLVGDPELRGRGIGKRATFGFLYYAFMVLDLHKVYMHSRDINVRNINLNSGFGFELEGVFLEDVPTPDGRRADLIRMALLKPLWLAVFGASPAAR